MQTKYKLKEEEEIVDSIYRYRENLAENFINNIVHFIASLLKYVSDDKIDELIVEEPIILSAIKNPPAKLKQKVFEKSAWSLPLVDNIDLRDITQITDQEKTNTLAIIDPDILRKHVNKEIAIRIAKQNNDSQFVNIFDTCEDCSWYDEAKKYCCEE